MLRSINAELLMLRKRVGVWVLLGIWTLLAAIFGYVFSYVTYLNGSSEDPAQTLARLAPAQVIGTLLEGYPFFGGVIVLVLGAMVFGGEYGWGTVKTVYTQGPTRLHILTSKLAALGIVLGVFVLVPFVVSLILSVGIGMAEGLSLALPSPWLIVKGFAAAWLMLAVWAALGGLLGVITKGTAIAIGIGVLYGLVIEGLLSALAGEISGFSSVAEVFLRTNGYSLIEPLGLSTEQVTQNGPGAFSGPYVGAVQAALVLVGYLVAIAAATATVLRRRDVT